MDWVYWTEDRVQYRIYVIMIISPLVPQNVGKIVTGLRAAGFSKMTVQHGTFCQLGK